MKRALIIRGGSMKGAFSVGVLEEFSKQGFGADKFDVIYSNSVGIFQQAFFASGQIDNIVKAWRDYVTGKQLIHYRNIFRRRAYIDVDYLIDLYKSDKCYLDLKALKSSKPELYCIVTDFKTKEPVLLDLKKHDVFQVMRATCAVPVLYHKKIIINGRRYYDGSLSISKIFDRLIGDLLKKGYDEVIVVVNKNNLIKHASSKVHIVEPSHLPLKGHLDTKSGRVHQTIEQGKKDAREFIKRLEI